MTALHKIIEEPSVGNKISALEELNNYIHEIKSKGWSGELEHFEQELHAYFQKAEREVLGDSISAYNIDVPVIMVEGELYTRCYHGPKSYMSASGKIEIERTLYRRSSDERAICPLELSLGIIENFWTPTAAQQAIWSTSHLTPGESEQLFKKLGNMTPSKSSLDRLPKKVGVHLEQEKFEYQAAVSASEAVPENAQVVALSLDGVMLPTRDKSEKGSCYKEASCGTLTFYDEYGESLSNLRFGRMPEYKKMTLKEQLNLELDKLFGKHPDLKLIKLADGACDNWSYLDKSISLGASLLDFYHMSEHLKSAFDAAYGEGSSKSLSQFEKYKSILCNDYSGAELLIRAVEYLKEKHPKSKKIKDELTYFRNNRHRMWYALALDNNYPIGSGPVEAACKTLVTERMKRSGMRWGNRGGQAILSFRSLVQSGRFEKTWNLVKGKYKKEVILSTNVVAFPGRRPSV